jgi:hypothetical protein
MICFYLFYCFLWDRPVLVTFGLLFREVSRAFDLGFSTKCWLLAGFGKAFRSTKLPSTGCLRGASEQDASEGFLFPILSLVMGTALYVYHSILP